MATSKSGRELREQVKQQDYYNYQDQDFFVHTPWAYVNELKIYFKKWIKSSVTEINT
jgi:hypothetical protein